MKIMRFFLHALLLKTYFILVLTKTKTALKLSFLYHENASVKEYDTIENESDSLDFQSMSISDEQITNDCLDKFSDTFHNHG